MTETPKPLPEKKVPKTPKAGPFHETAAFARVKSQQPGITQAEKDDLQRLSDEAYRQSMLAQLQGLPVEDDSLEQPGEWPHDKSEEKK